MTPASACIVHKVYYNIIPTCAVYAHSVLVWSPRHYFSWKDGPPICVHIIIHIILLYYRCTDRAGTQEKKAERRVDDKNEQNIALHLHGIISASGVRVPTHISSTGTRRRRQEQKPRLLSSRANSRRRREAKQKKNHTTIALLLLCNNNNGDKKINYGWAECFPLGGRLPNTRPGRMRDAGGWISFFFFFVFYQNIFVL